MGGCDVPSVRYWVTTPTGRVLWGGFLEQQAAEDAAVMERGHAKLVRHAPMPDLDVRCGTDMYTGRVVRTFRSDWDVNA